MKKLIFMTKQKITLAFLDLYSNMLKSKYKIQVWNLEKKRGKTNETRYSS